MAPPKTHSLFFFFFVFIIVSTLFQLSFSSSASITLTPKTLLKSGDAVQIKWTGIQSPSDLDWLGIYSPPNSSHDNFIGYVFLSSCKDWNSGSCSIQLPLVNLRANYEFRIFRWTDKEIDKKHVDHDHNPIPGIKHLLVRSPQLGFAKGGGPEQIHLALTGEDDEMRVMFVTEDGKESFVKYGEEENGMERIEKTVATRYEREDMCHAPANESIGWRDPGFIHDGVMKNLREKKRYYYKVGSDAGGWSATHSFMSPNGNSDETNAFLFGDMGTATPYATFVRTQEESKSTVKWILRDIEALGDKPAIISHIGDISYARGYSWLWDTFFTQVEPLASLVPYHVCIGNHEYDWLLQPWRPDWSETIYKTDGGGECGVPYSLKFNMPGNSSTPTGTRAPATRNLFYSFNAGVVHFVYMSTETNFLPGSDQYNFIKHDLETADRKKTPFVVVQGHRPMYTTSNEAREAELRNRMLEHYEPLFVKNKVNLALWGHVHRYERFCPLQNHTCAVKSLNEQEKKENLPVHVVIGMAGQDWQPIWEPRPDHPKDPIYPQPDRSLYRGGEFGYTRLVATKEKLTLTYIGNHDGLPHDKLEILASGHVLDAVDQLDIKVDQLDIKDGSREVTRSSRFSWYVKVGSVLLLGAFVGYVIGFMSHAKRTAGSGASWIPVKSDEA